MTPRSMPLSLRRRYRTPSSTSSETPVSYKDLRALMADLKAVYAAAHEQAPLDALDAFSERWEMFLLGISLRNFFRGTIYSLGSGFAK